MFKKLLSKILGKPENDKKALIEEKTADLLVSSFISNSEEYNLSTVQDRLEQSLYLMDENPNEVIRLMKGNCLVLQTMLVTSRQTYTSDKLMFILSSTSRIVQCLFKLDKYSEAIKEIEAISFYRQDALMLYPSNWNILLSACNLSCQLVEIYLKLGQFKEENIKESLEIVDMLELCAHNLSRKCSMCKTIEHTADVLFDNSYYDYAKMFYRCAYGLFTREELIAHRDQVSNLGCYNVCLLKESDQDISQFEDSFREEIEMFTIVRSEYDNDCRSLMDLAIAHSHYAEYYLQKGDITKMLTELTEKISLNTLAYGSENSIYTHEQIEQSVLNSVQTIIKETAYLPESVKIESLELSIECLNIFINNNSSNIQFFINANYIAMELFWCYKKNDDGLLAAKYLFMKIMHLCILFNKYGSEKEIITDMVNTYEECVNFIKQNESSLTKDQNKIWAVYVHQLSTCLKETNSRC